MTSGIYRVTWSGPGDIVWEKLANNFSHIEVGKKLITLAASTAAVASTVGAGLSLIAVIQNGLISARLGEVQKDVSNIKARFDLLFLDRSLDYFQFSHQGQLGVRASLAEALRQDCMNALSQLVQDRSLFMPAFLRHRSMAVSNAIAQFSQLTYAVLHDGQVNVLVSEAIKPWVKEISSVQGVSPDGGYISQRELLRFWHDELIVRDQAKRTGSLVGRLSSRERSTVDNACEASNFERCFEVLLLYREIETFLRYADILSSKPIREGKSGIHFSLTP